MPDNNLPNFSENDPLDINELASLNNDITEDFIEQLQDKLSQETGVQSKELDKGADSSNPDKPLNLRFDDSIDDNFIKKYKAKLNKQQNKIEQEAQKEPQKHQVLETPTDETKKNPVEPNIPEIKEAEPIPVKPAVVVEPTPTPVTTKPQKAPEPIVAQVTIENKEIETLTSGSIIEKTAEQEQLEYNESLDFLDGNIKYSKYVIYIDPENTEFIDSLTVKERKNLINRILREQDNIAITKRRLNLIQTIIKHTIVAIVTISISIPIIYFLINASLEASINNHRRSQNMFKTLLNEQGKLKKTPASLKYN